MIKINLLESVTERQGSKVVAVERKIGSPASRLTLMSLAVMFLFLGVVGLDVISTYLAKQNAETELAEQKQIQIEMQAVLQEQKELQAKIKNIDLRIDAIKKLRASQAGPGAVLAAMVERILMVPGLYLKSIEQSGDQLIIEGNSRDEMQVTQFGRSLEFSGGLFSNLTISTERKEVQSQQTGDNSDRAAVNRLEVVDFTIKCNYTPEKSGSSSDASVAENAKPAESGTAPQIAKN